MFRRFGDQWAVRKCDWKLVVSKMGSGRPKLYDLAADVGEQCDLTASEPDRVAELQSFYGDWIALHERPVALPERPVSRDNDPSP